MGSSVRVPTDGENDFKTVSETFLVSGGKVAHFQGKLDQLTSRKKKKNVI